MNELIHNFGIDWKLLLAQAVNFFILLFLLKKFAYRPLLEIMKKRRLEIEQGLEFSEKARVELRNIGVAREVELKKARGEALAIISTAEDSGKQRKGEIVQEAQRKVEGVVADAKRLIEEEKAKMGEMVVKDARILIQQGLEKVLGKMLPEEKNQPLIEEALRESKTLPRK